MPAIEVARETVATENVPIMLHDRRREFETDECQVILPCTGDRMFGQTQDDEMAFSIPASKLDEVMEGLQSTHKNGIRYPVPTFMNYTAKFPAKYEAVWDIWGDKKPSER